MDWDQFEDKQILITFIHLGTFRFPGNCQSCNAVVFRGRGQRFQTGPIGVEVCLCDYCAEKLIFIA